VSENSATRFELWKLHSGYTFFPENNEAARKLLEPGAKLAWTVEAKSWEEARARMHEFLGWEPYKPPKSPPAG
jgi:hypothetical protein